MCLTKTSWRDAGKVAAAAAAAAFAATIFVTFAMLLLLLLLLLLLACAAAAATSAIAAAVVVAAAAGASPIADGVLYSASAVLYPRLDATSDQHSVQGHGPACEVKNLCPGTVCLAHCMHQLTKHGR